MTAPLLRIASRGSPLAVTQSRLARAALAAAHGWPEADLDALCPILTFRTTGDRIQDRPLAEAGGKGLFVKEIEDALLQGEADVAVHSMKDMPGVQPGGLALVAMLPREDPRDVLISPAGGGFAGLKPGARLGTSSVRRQAQALRLRPDLSIVPLRGNVETRLAKLARGDADATLLAHAGLSRLGVMPPGAEALSTELWLPALCQGAIGLEARAEDARVHSLLTSIDDPVTHLSVMCERGFLTALDGSCRTPIGGLARFANGTVRFRGEVLSTDGRNMWTAARDVPANPMVDADRRRAFEAGQDAAREVRARAGDALPRA